MQSIMHRTFIRKYSNKILLKYQLCIQERLYIHTYCWESIEVSLWVRYKRLDSTQTHEVWTKICIFFLSATTNFMKCSNILQHKWFDKDKKRNGVRRLKLISKCFTCALIVPYSAGLIPVLKFYLFLSNFFLYILANVQ